MDDTEINKWYELERLQEYFISERECNIFHLLEVLEESTEFDRGRRAGYIMAIDAVLDYVRDRLKYG